MATTQIYYDISKGNTSPLNYQILSVNTTSGNRSTEEDKGKLIRVDGVDYGVLSNFIQTDPNYYDLTVKSSETAQSGSNITTNSGVGNGVSTSISTKVSASDLTILTNEKSVLESVMNIISTEKKSKVFNKRNFGTSLLQYLHNPVDIHTAIDLFEVIERGINTYEPRALNLVVTVTPAPNENTFYIEISFDMEESQAPVVLNTNLKKLR